MKLMLKWHVMQMKLVLPELLCVLCPEKALLVSRQPLNVRMVDFSPSLAAMLCDHRQAN